MKNLFTLFTSIILLTGPELSRSQTTYTWANPASGGAWNNSANWTPNTGFPADGDNAVINPTASITITNVPAISISTITIGGASLTDSVILTASSTDTLTVNGNVTVTGGGLFKGANLTLNFISCSSYIHNMNGGTIPTATWGENSNCNVIGITNTAPANMAQNFYNFLWDCPSQSATITSGFGSNFPTGINGTCEFRRTNSEQCNWTLKGTITWAGDLVVSGARILMVSGALTAPVYFTMRDFTLSDTYDTSYTDWFKTNNSGTNYAINMYMRNFSMTGSSTSGFFDFLNIEYDPTNLYISGNFTMNGGMLRSSNNIENGYSANDYIYFNGTTQQNINISNISSYAAITTYLYQSTLVFVAESGSIINFQTDFTTGTGSQYVTFTANSGSTIMIPDPNGIIATAGATTGSVQTPAAGGGATFSTGANYIYNGTAAQVTGSGLPGTVNNFTVNNTAGVTLTNNLSINGALALPNGNLSLGAKNITLLTGATLAGTLSNSNMVIANGTGQFIRAIPANSGSFIFPVGDAAPFYSPVTLNFLSNSNAGTVGVRVTNSAEPNNDNPTAPSSYLSRYWTFSNTLSSNYSFTGTFAYPEANVEGTESAIKLSQWTGSSWFEDDTGSSALSGILTIEVPLNQTTAPLNGDFTGRVQSSSSCTSPFLSAMANGTAASINICSGGAPASISLTANPTAGSGCTGTFEYAWFNGSNYWNGTDFASATPVYNSTYNSVSYSASAYAVYTVSGRCSNNTSCISSSSVSVNFPPSVTPSITISTEYPVVNYGTPVTFIATPVNGGSSPSYQWQKNGVNVGTNSNTYTDSALNNNDVITCILTSSAGCPTSVTATSNAITMTVFVKVTPSLTISASQTAVCRGTVVTFTAMPDNGGTLPSYQWRKNGLDVGLNSATYKDSSLSNNDIIYCVLTSNAACLAVNTATSNSITMTAADTVIATIAISASSDTVCAGTAVNFTAAITNGGANPVYKWEVNGDSTGTNSPDFTSNTLHNNDIITCLLTSSASCAGGSPTSNAVIMTVNPLASAGVVSAQRDTICSGGQVSLSVTGNSGNIQWQSSFTGVNYTDINNASGTTYSTTLLQTTFFRVYTTGATCNDTSAALQLLVDTLPPSPVLAANDTLICAGDSIQICATGEYTSYLWNNGATTNCTYANAAGGYWVTATGANGCSIISRHLGISVYAVPSVSVIVHGDTLSSFNALEYQWYYNDSLIIGATAATYVATQEGNYSVQITDSNGCKASSSNVNVTITGITDLYGNEIGVYPNPSLNGNWQLAVDNGLVGSTLEIYDDNGRLILQSVIRNQKSEISLNAGQGVYLLRIYTPAANITRRLIRL